jgi:gas vesicle protein
MSLTPVPSEGATCANCSAPLVADQRYCLSCGQPTSPVRLAFLDVLQSERQSPATQLPMGATPVAYTPLLEPTGPSGWVRRYSPLLGAMSVLLLALIAGLLVGHWVTQNKTPSQQVLKVEGLTAPAAAAVATTPTTPATTTPTSKSNASEVKEEAEEAANEVKAEKVQAQKVEKAKTLSENSSSLSKLHKTSGKQHAEEVNSLGAQPIETK